MFLSTLDWGIVIGFLALTLFVGFWVSKRASKDSSSYFLGGRNMPWWLLGTSMVATTFAADTPNLVTDIVRSQGVSGNWVWWCMLLTGMLTTFVYARLWRRLGVTTDIEFYERRYSGRSAEYLRGFRAVYLGVFFNVMIMATVTLAAIKIGSVLFNMSPLTMVLAAGGVTVLFSALGGFLGVLVTDMILFVTAMIGSGLAAYYSLSHPAVGGIDGLMSNPEVASKLSMLPDFREPSHWVPLFLIPLAVQWWASWYPGAEPGGGGYIAQRMLAAKDENHAVAASAFFNIAHYALRPWPWILVALASIIVYPDLASIKAALPHVPDSVMGEDLAYSAMLLFLPAGVLGLVVASLVSAYISTISTHLNWGASYAVNDFYNRFINTNATDKQQVMVGRVMTVLLMVAASLMALVLESALQAFQLLLSIGAGTGLLFILRWFWTRINVWSEISAMVLSFAFSLFIQFGPYANLVTWEKFVASVILTTIGWVAVTLMTSPTDKAQLDAFNKAIKGQEGEIKTGLYATLACTAAIYGFLFTTGNFIFGDYMTAGVLAAITIVCGFTTMKLVKSE